MATDHACAIKADGTLWCWGLNDYGAIGDGTTTTPRSTPVQVTALGNTVVQVATAYESTCARKADGSLWCWGRNLYGQAGDGTTTPKSTPIPVTSLGNSVAEVAVSDWVTCARKTDGTLWCFGYNSGGEVGDGTTDSPKLAPTQVNALGNTVRRIAAQDDVYAIRADGSLWSWGVNYFGELGNSTPNGMVGGTPGQVLVIGNTVVEVAAGDSGACARKADGSLWCWGNNTFGDCGDGTQTSPRTSPVEVVNFTTGALQVAKGHGHGCAIKTGASLWCWGLDNEGQLGNGATSNNYFSSPIHATAITDPVAQVVTGGNTTCVLKTDGTVWCFGDNLDGQLGNGTSGSTTTTATPVKVLLSCP